MAALIQSLVVSGSRLSTGEPNDTGTVWAYEPGTTSPAILYADADATVVITQPITLDVGGRISVDTYPDGVWVTAPVRLLIEDVNGDPVTDATFWPSDARTDMLDNDNYPDAATVDEALTQLAESLGGTNGSFLESAGATEQPVSDVLRAPGIWVTSFGAIGNGIAIDTTAIQSAMNRAKALSTSLLFPAGTFITDQAITASSAVGLRIIGAGMTATIISNTNATANAFTITSCDDLVVEGIQVTHATTSTGSAFALTTCDRPVFRGVYTPLATGHTYGVNLNDCDGGALYSCSLSSPGGTSGAGLLSTGSSNWTMVGGRVDGGDSYSAIFDGASGDIAWVGVEVANSLRYAATLTGTNFTFVGCDNASTTSVATATIPGIRLFGGTPLSSSGSAAIGASITPSLLQGTEIILTASSGGAGVVTVNNPAVLPTTSTSAGRNLFWDVLYINTSGGAVTWTHGTAYRLSAAIPTTDTNRIRVRFGWDPAAGLLREASRSETAA